MGLIMAVWKRHTFPCLRDNPQNKPLHKQNGEGKSKGPKVDPNVLRGLTRGRVSVKRADKTALKRAKAGSTFT